MGATHPHPPGLSPGLEHSTVRSCSLAATPPPKPLPEAVRVSYGQAAAAATEAWPAALEFPPTNNFYKPPAS